jgi:FtsH-binding integral membrane protein
VFDRHVYWYLSASWILLVLLAFVSTNNAAFTGSVTLLVAVVVVLPLLMFALFAEGRQPPAPAPVRANSTRRSHRLTKFRS